MYVPQYIYVTKLKWNCLFKHSFSSCPNVTLPLHINGLIPVYQ